MMRWQWLFAVSGKCSPRAGAPVVGGLDAGNDLSPGDGPRRT